MSFPEEVVKQAWSRAGGQCECKREGHSHFYSPCGKVLIWENRNAVGRGGWEIRQIAIDGGEVSSNCEIICSSCGGLKSFSMPV